MINSFYEQLERLRDALAEAGFAHWARDLLTAERSASTSGEAISNTSVVLRKIQESDELDEDLQEEVSAALAEGTRIWNSAG